MLADPAGDFLRAVGTDDDRTVQALLAKGVDPNTSEPNRGEDALILAIRDDAMKVFALLLAQPGIQVDQPARNGNTALMMAAFKRNKQAALDLIAHGAAINKPGWTPLHYAAAAGDAEITALLLDRKAAINALAPGDITPLMIAAREGKEETVRLLLTRGADVRPVNGEHLNAEQLALQRDHRQIAELIRAAAH
ncbi:MAG: ankyrin repeat domain-containing protein [Telluria sp.]